MKVLITSSFFPSSKSDHLPQFLLEQALALARLRPEVEFRYLAASRAQESMDSLSLPDNLKVVRFNYFWPRRLQLLTEHGILSSIATHKLTLLTLPFLFLFEYLAIRKQIRLFQPDIVYSHWMLPQALLAHNATKLADIKHVMTSHSSDIEILFRMGKPGRKLAIAILQSLSAFNVVGERSRSFLLNHLPADVSTSILQKCIVLPMGVPDEFISQIRELKQKKIPVSKKELLFLGRLTEKKGVMYLLDALQVLKRRGIDTHLTIAGEGLQEAKIRRYVEHNNLSDIVTLTGFVSGNDKAELLAKSDIFILPSVTTPSMDREGLPVALIENMLCGNICLATDDSGAEDIISEDCNGFLVPSNDATAIANKLAEIISSDQDTLSRVSESAQKDTQRLLWSELIRKYNQHLLT